MIRLYETLVYIAGISALSIAYIFSSPLPVIKILLYLSALALLFCALMLTIERRRATFKRRTK